MRWPARRRARRGIALADFIAGMMVFSAVIMVFAELTRSKFLLLTGSELRSRALSAAEETIDGIRRNGLGGRPKGKADRQGFRKVRTFELDGHRMPLNSEGVVAVRSIKMIAGKGYQLYEARVSVRYRSFFGCLNLEEKC